MTEIKIAMAKIICILYYFGTCFSSTALAIFVGQYGSNSLSVVAGWYSYHGYMI